jgi:hypothetical protein
LTTSRTVREAAVASLSRPDHAVGSLIALLEEPDARVRRGVCEALAQRGEAVAVPALLLEGSPEAARACVAIAEERLLDLPASASVATPAMRDLLVRAHAASVNDRIGRVGATLQLMRPQVHRAHMAGGAWSERTLLGIARDADQPMRKRAHALHVAQLMLGPAVQDDLVALLEDPHDEVRSAAVALLWRLHTTRGNRELAQRLDRGEQFGRSELTLLVSAVVQGAKPSARGVEFLASRIATADPSLAADAAGALMQIDRARATTLLTQRVRDEIRSSDGPQVAIFFLRCGTPGRELTALAGQTKDPLARLAALASAERIKVAIRDHLNGQPGSTEWIRVLVVSTLLGRHVTAWDDRVRYARGVLDTDIATWRAGGLAVLRGAPADVLAPLRPRLVASLGDPSESVRVNAAILLMPEPGAQRVLWSALYDGDLRTAWTAGPALDADLGRQTPVAERRRRAREALAALDRR